MYKYWLEHEKQSTINIRKLRDGSLRLPSSAFQGSCNSAEGSALQTLQTPGSRFSCMQYIDLVGMQVLSADSINGLGESSCGCLPAAPLPLQACRNLPYKF